MSPSRDVNWSFDTIFSASWLSDSTVENTVQRSVSTSADATAGTTQPRIAYTVCTGCPGHNDIASGTSHERDEE